jgi:hypothetical protein
MDSLKNQKDTNTKAKAGNITAVETKSRIRRLVERRRLPLSQTTSSTTLEVLRIGKYWTQLMRALTSLPFEVGGRFSFVGADHELRMQTVAVSGRDRDKVVHTGTKAHVQFHTHPTSVLSDLEGRAYFDPPSVQDIVDFTRRSASGQVQVSVVFTSHFVYVMYPPDHEVLLPSPKTMAAMDRAWVKRMDNDLAAGVSSKRFNTQIFQEYRDEVEAATGVFVARFAWRERLVLRVDLGGNMAGNRQDTRTSSSLHPYENPCL